MVESNLSVWEDVRSIARSLIGGRPISTLDQRKPNWIVDEDDVGLWVETEASRRKGRGPRLVEWQWVEEAVEQLRRNTPLEQSDLSRPGRHRSAFTFGLLAESEHVRFATRPLRLWLR